MCGRPRGRQQGAQGVGRDQGRGVQKAGGEFREGLGAGGRSEDSWGHVHRGRGRLGKERRGPSGQLLSNILSKLELHLISHLVKAFHCPGNKRFETIGRGDVQP